MGNEQSIMNQPGHWDYFISYATVDASIIAEKIYSSMTLHLPWALRKSCWLDVYMKARDADAMEEGVKNSKTFVLVLSKLYFTRDWCRKEIQWAIKYKIPTVIVTDVKYKDKIGNLLKKCPTSLVSNITSFNVIDLNLRDSQYFNLGMQMINESNRKLMFGNYRLSADNNNSNNNDDNNNDLEKSPLLYLPSGIYSSSGEDDENDSDIVEEGTITCGIANSDSQQAAIEFSTVNRDHKSSIEPDWDLGLVIRAEKDPLELMEEYRNEFPITPRGRPSPFVVACEKGRFVDVKLFIKGYKRVHGADSNVYAMVTESGKNSHGYIMPPIVAAAYNEHHDIVAYLIQNDCKKHDVIDFLTNEYKKEFPPTLMGAPDPFVVACEKGRFADVKLFVMYHDQHTSGITVQEMINRKGKTTKCFNRTALMKAAKYEYDEIVKYLLEHGADPTIQTEGGRNSLHFAAMYSKRNMNTIMILLDRMLKKHYDINCRTLRREFTPVDYVYFCNSCEFKDHILRLLRFYGGKGNKFDDDNGQLLGTCPGFCSGFSRTCLNLHYKLLQD